jgi:hypothetical protein
MAQLVSSSSSHTGQRIDTDRGTHLLKVLSQLWIGQNLTLVFDCKCLETRFECAQLLLHLSATAATAATTAQCGRRLGTIDMTLT